MTCKLDRVLEPLTARQAEILRWIADFSATHQMPPSLREIGAAMHITSTNGVNDHLVALERKGYIRRGSMKSRTVIVLFDATGAPFLASEAAETRALRLRVAELESAHASLLGRLASPRPSCAPARAACVLSLRCPRRR